MQIDQLSGPAMVRAYNELATIRQIKQVNKFADRKTGAIRLEASLQLVAEVHPYVRIAEDGAVSIDPIPAPGDKATPTAVVEGPTSSETAGGEVAPKDERRVSPGLARLAANLGAEGTQALRDKVEADGKAALKTVAAERAVDGEPGTTAQDTGSDAGADKTPTPARAALPTDFLSLEKLLSKTTDAARRDEIKVALKALNNKPAAASAAPRSSAPAPRASAPRAAGKAPAVADTDVITVNVPGGTNPKRAVAAERFAKYTTGMTVAQYSDAIKPLSPQNDGRKQALRDIAWDMKQGWISVAGAAKAGK